MILISKGYLWLFGVVLGLLWTGYGVAGFLFDSETLLFLGILGFLLLGLLIIGLISTGRSATHKAKRLLGTSLDSPKVSEQWTEAMGDLGTAIFSHERRLIEANWSLTGKVQSMHRLVSFLSRNFPTPLFVSDTYGKLVYVSPSGALLVESSARSLIGDDLRRIFPEFRLFPVLSALEQGLGRTTLSWSNKKVRVYGLSGKTGAPEYLLLTLNTEKFEEPELEIPEEVAAPSKNQAKESSFFGRLRQSFGKVLKNRN
ncbi:MAG: hypothetical protein GW949_09215 [Spirochaetales bacterium]|nr:hypothetical protein [Spirochaetales bacterium]